MHAVRTYLSLEAKGLACVLLAVIASLDVANSWTVGSTSVAGKFLAAS